jgi:hypothetical protein
MAFWLSEKPTNRLELGAFRRHLLCVFADLTVVRSAIECLGAHAGSVSCWCCSATTARAIGSGHVMGRSRVAAWWCRNYYRNFDLQNR